LPTDFIVHRLYRLPEEEIVEGIKQTMVGEYNKPPTAPKDPRVTAVLGKMAATGIPLRKYCQGQIYSGIVTGLNAAFVLDQRTHDLLVAQDSRSVEILKPFLGPKDIKPWRVEWRGMWLIYTYHGIDIESYPAVLNYLRTFQSRLEQRRKKFAWYELSRPRKQARAALEQPKLIYPGIANVPKYVFDDLGHYYVGNNVYFIANVDRYLQGVLGSRVLWFYLTSVAPMLKQGYYRLYIRDVGSLPIPIPPEAERSAIASLTAYLSDSHGPDRLAVEAELNDRLASLYGLTTEEELRIVEGISLPPLTPESEDEL
jgi:adenine-specific DNA-methyltransferase